MKIYFDASSVPKGFSHCPTHDDILNARIHSAETGQRCSVQLHKEDIDFLITRGFVKLSNICVCEGQVSVAIENGQLLEFF